MKSEYDLKKKGAGKRIEHETAAILIKKNKLKSARQLAMK